jgi:serine protease AprX
MANTIYTMKKYLLFLVLLAGVATQAEAQFSRYIIRLKDKGTSPYSISNPSQYLSARALQRRTRYNIAIDSADLPITPRYIDSIRLAGAVTILNTSKWLNQVAIQTTDVAALAKINSFPFVIDRIALAPRNAPGKPVNKKFDTPEEKAITTPTQQKTLADFYSYGQSYAQVHIHNGEFLHNRGFRGQGMHMAIMDAGFQNYLTIPTFDSARRSGQILGTWDFVARNTSVNEDHPHGTNCFSAIAANMPGVFVGTAPKTSFYLYRTEEAATEYPIEEQNWAAAAELSDSLGVDICSVSLGYTTFDNPVFDHVYLRDMNGDSTIISRAADVAAKKGMLMVIAAGNEGTSSWRYISAPADADSVMAVGAVSTSGAVGSFSSFGPSSDQQVKPSVSGVGVGAVVASSFNGQPIFGNGTSFACPNIAGLATCLWQAFPEVNNMTIINTLQQSATRASNPDTRVGYGIPDVKKAFVTLLRQGFTKQTSQANCKASLLWSIKADSAMPTIIERKLGNGAYTTVSTNNSTGAFIKRDFSFIDDLITVTATTITYRFSIQVATDTTVVLDSVTINFAPKPNLGTDKTVAVCNNNSINLTTQFTTTGLTNVWTLSGNAVANPAVITSAGAYQLIGTNTSGCADTAVVNASFLPKPDLGADKTAGKCTDSTFNATTLFTTTGLTTAWTLNGAAVSNPAAITTPGTYQLVVTNSSNCTDTATVTITNNAQLCPPVIERIQINPNPVVDKLNIAIVRIAAVTAEIKIVNAAGQIIFTQRSKQTAGGQTYSIPMKELAAGLYYVTIKINGKKEVLKAVMKK